MFSNLAKLALLVVAMALIAIVVGGVTPTSADTSQQAPPTVVLPTPVATKPPPRATPTSGVAPKVAPTKAAPTKAATATRTATRAALRQPRSIPGPSGTFSSAFTIQNMSTSSANCSYTIYNASGGTAYTSASFAIPVGGSNFTYVPNIGGLASGQYSAVITCDQQVAAVVNSSTNNSGASYGGVVNPGTTWYAPNAYNNYYGFYTNFVIQNATSSPVNATLQVIDQSGSVVATQTANNIPAYASAGLDQTGLAGLNPNVNYSAKITATGNIAVEANIYGTGAYENQLYSYSPFASGSTIAYAPVIMNNYWGYNTALTVQNIGTSGTTVTVTYGTGHTQTQYLAPSASYLFYTPSSGVPSGNTLGLTSAKIESTGGQPIVALVNESNNYNRAGSYTGFASGATTVRTPIIMKRYWDYNTSVTCQNVGTSNTNMTITYSNGASSTQNNIAANGTALFYQPNEAGLPNGFNGSATITSSSQPIVCVVNEDTNEGTKGTTIWDHLFTYEGINQTP